MHPSRWPRPLRPGETIAVVAPAGPVRLEDLSRGLRYLRRRGYRLKLGAAVRGRWHYLSGHDDERLADLHRAYADHDVQAVWCARGGYGTMRLLARLDYGLIDRRGIPLIGYSDITALQLAILTQTGLRSYSGPMVGTVHGFGAVGGVDPLTEASVWEWVGGARHGRLAGDGLDGLRVVQSGAARGPLIGGNLSLLAALVGTPYLPDLDGAVLVLEDIGETPYRVDRMLSQLALAGVFERVAGVVLGDFATCFPPATEEPGPPVEELVAERLARPDVPLVSGLAYGHIDRRVTLPLGATVVVDTAVGRIVVVDDEAEGS